MITEKLETIRSLLDELEQDVGIQVPGQRLADYSALEIPKLVEDIVDYLMPILDPYATAFYWHLFRHSVLKTGGVHVRAGKKSLQSGVVNSAVSKSGNTSFQRITEALDRLQKLGAIRKEGEPTRDGTLYRLLLPEEIPECRDRMAAASTNQVEPKNPAGDIDFYNIAENRTKVFERDEFKCKYCGKQLTRFTATLDHVQPVSEGGDNSFDNLITACLTCNSRKNKKPLSEFLANGA